MQVREVFEIHSFDFGTKLFSVLEIPFFNQREIKNLFSKFKIISLQLEEKKSFIPNNKKNSAWWLIISKK